MATIAAVGAASAQTVTLSGEVEFGYQSVTTAAGVTTAGMGKDTARVIFGVSEDLGSGMSIGAKLSINTGDIGAGSKSDDQSLTVTTPVASISLYTLSPGDWTSSASGAATWNGLDGRVFGGRSNRDGITVTMPLAAGLTGSVSYQEPANVVGYADGSVNQGLSTVTGKNNQSVTAAALAYKAGPANISAQFLQFLNVDASSDLSAGTVSRLGGNIDLGVAKVGAALQWAKTGAGGTTTLTALAASAPLTPSLSVQGVYGTSNVDSSDAGSYAVFPVGRKSGYMLGMQYNLSKRTYAILNVGNWRQKTTDTADTSMYYASLVHDF